MASNMPEQVIGAAARDPKIQAAAVKALASSPIQRAAWNHGTAVATDAARTGAAAVQKEFLEIKTYIQHSHFTVKIVCFCCAVALAISSVLGMLNVFSAALHPFQYLFSIYNLAFAFLIVIMDGNSEWFLRCGDLQNKVYSLAPVLASHLGRALFYLYVGSINLVMLPSSWFGKLVYIVIGSALSLVGVSMLVQRCIRKPEAEGVGNDQV